MKKQSPHTIGLILAGGKSSRMGYDKTHANWHGTTFLDNAISTLDDLGVDQIQILGLPKHPLGVPDIQPHAGPGVAISHALNGQKAGTRVVTIPIDMPLLTSDMLRHLIQAGPNTYFKGQYFPSVLTVSKPQPVFERVRETLAHYGAVEVEIPDTFMMGLKGCNTPAELASLQQEQRS